MTSAKYIGMDVHKESISIAVMNFAGKVVMECVIETKASTILQFIHGLRGDVHVTFEEGTWAAWLYDLLKPHVTELVVCNPRKNALLKEGSKSDQIDARKLADLLYMNKLSSVYHGETWPAHVEGIVPQLFDDQQGSRAGDESAQGVVSELGHSLCWDASLCTALPFGMVEQDSPKPACAGGRNFTTNNSTLCGCCANKPGKNCWPRLGSTAPRSCYARFLVLVRFERLSWLR